MGDVAGKNLAAATRTMEVKFAPRAFLSEYREPGWALSRLNDFLCDAQKADERPQTFVAVALAVVDTESGEILAAGAGAEPPLVLRGGETEALDAAACRWASRRTSRTRSGRPVLRRKTPS